jgi:hypothetical protein
MATLSDSLSPHTLWSSLPSVIPVEFESPSQAASVIVLLFSKL